MTDDKTWYLCRACGSLVDPKGPCPCNTKHDIEITDEDIENLFNDDEYKVIEGDGWKSIDLDSKPTDPLKRSFGWDDWRPDKERDELLKRLHRDPKQFVGHINECPQWHRTDYNACSCDVALKTKRET